MKLYIYDHCPFCVRARMIFGLRGVAAEQIVLPNDDEDTPIRMIGAKQLPILEKDDGTFMGESLDIVRHIDETAGKGRLKEDVRPEIQAWLDRVGAYANKLVQPRDVLAGFAEFATASAAAYFTERKEKLIGSFADNLAESSRYLAQLDADLAELENLIALPESADAAGMEDILLFPVLRNLTIVRGLKLPPKTAAYVSAVSAMCGVPLLADKAV
ncbi:Glutaredoxin-2 [Kingella potus]|uniref:Glutaredoxin-2 n=1 Tax=Kingella potus TaxID=265175 RepID=A0A377R2A2_9NEIS|nr:glutaredoxin 2 [Kingella potus]UOP00716.1 glutaredoxin 2 [Kingella potus]STR02887.1 Glutaredoxin-2 [Kingella potus]